MHLTTCCATVYDEENGMVVFDTVKRFSNFGGQLTADVAEFRNQSIRWVDESLYFSLCSQGLEIDRWRARRQTTSDFIVIAEMEPNRSLACDGNLSAYARGEFFTSWCAYSSNILVLFESDSVYYSNCMFGQTVPDDCTFLFAVGNWSGVRYLQDRPGLRVTIKNDVNRWEFLQNHFARFVAQFVFPACYLSVTARMVWFIYQRFLDSNWNRNLLLIVILEVPGLATLGVVGFFYGTHCIGEIGFDTVIFLFSEFFGLSVAADLVLALMYYQVTTKLSGYTADASNSIFTCFLGFALTLGLLDSICLFLVAYVLPSSKIAGLIVALLPMVLFAVQVGTIFFLVYRIHKMSQVVKANILSDSSNSVVSGDSLAQIARLEKTLRFNAKLSIIGSLMTLTSLTLISLGIYKWGPRQYILSIFTMKIGRVVNSISRSNVLRNPRARKRRVKSIFPVASLRSSQIPSSSTVKPLDGEKEVEQKSSSMIQ